MAETAGPVSLVLGVTQIVELSATPNTQKLLIAGPEARYYKIVPITYDGKLVRGGTENTALSSTAYEPLAGDVPSTIRVPGSGDGRMKNFDSAATASNSRRIALASATASATFSVTALP